MSMAEGRNGTVNADSLLGQRLSKVRRQNLMFLVFQGRSMPITSRITIGRDPHSSIELKDPMVSRHHSLIQKVKDEFFIKDLCSTNGTFVNGQPVPPGKYLRLSQLDFIVIGHTELSLQQLGVEAFQK